MSGEGPELPVRPYVPPVSAAAAAVALVAWVLLDASWRDLMDGTITFRSWVFGFAFGVCALAAAAVVFRGRAVAPWLFWSCVGLFLGVVSSVAWVTGMTAQLKSLDGSSVSSLTLEADADPTPTSTGYMVAATGSRDGARLGLCLMSSEEIERGERVRAVGRISRLEDDDWGRSRYLAGQVATVRVVKVLKKEGSNGDSPLLAARRALLKLIRPADSEGSSVVAGILCGRSTEAKEQGLKELFSRTGTSHLMAVSGTHLAVVSAMILKACDALGLSLRKRKVLTCGGMAMYAVLTGLSISAVRTLIMNLAASMTSLSDRRNHALSNLMLAVSIMIALDASAVFDLGFQLSVVSVGVILLFGDYAAYVLGCLRVPRGLSEVLSVSLVAQLATVPVAVPVFGTFSLIGPIANIVAVPLVSALLVIGLPVGVASLALSRLAFAFWAPRAISCVLVFWLRLMDGIPFSCVNVDAPGGLVLVSALLAVGLYLWWPKVRARFVLALGGAAMLCFACHIVRWSFFAPAEVVVLDVGQADAILIREGSRAVLVDVGVDEEVERALWRNNVYRLDAVVITHWDEDHWGGFPTLAKTIRPDRVVVNEGAADSAPQAFADSCTSPIVEMEEGDALHVGEFKLTKVWPRVPVRGEENGESLCLLVQRENETEDFRMLLTGDTEKDEEAEYDERVSDIDVLKVGHHGSKVSVDEGVLSVLKPEVAVASAGAGNTYGHPSEECREALEQAGSKFLCTIDEGDVSIRPCARGYEVSTSGPHDA